MVQAVNVQRYDLRAGVPDGVAAFLDRHAPSLFLTADWFALLASAGLEAADQPTLLSVERAGEPCCVLPLRYPVVRRAGVPFRMAASLTNYYSLDYAAVCVPGAEALAGQALRQERVPLMRFDSMDAPAADRLATLLQAAGHRPRRFESFVNWTEAPGDAGFDAWFARRPSKLRNTWRRRSRKLAERGRARIDCHGWPALAARQAGAGALDDTPQGAGIAVRHAERLDTLIDAWTTVYARSWKQPEPFADFVPGLIRLAARRNWLRLGVLYLDDRPVAAQLWLHDRGRAVIYKLAYDEDFRELSPGLALSVEMFRNTIELDRATLIDYGSGDDPYKQDWMSTRRVRVGIEAFNRRHPLGLLGEALNSIREHLPA